MYVLNKISYFNPPISPFRTESGQLYPATVVPSAKVSVEQLYRMIVDPDGRLARLTNQVRASKDYRSAKVQMLPYVTPYGVFSERRSKGLLSYSGLIPLDFDYLVSEFEAQELRDWIFSDNRLDAKLVFVSPSGRGVKAFISYERLLEPGEVVCKQTLNRFLENALFYVSSSFGRDLGACADHSGKDIARACLLCHDAGAKFQV